MTIEIRECEQTMTYTVYVNGEAVLECLAEDEVEELTLGEITEMAKRYQ